MRIPLTFTLYYANLTLAGQSGLFLVRPESAKANSSTKSTEMEGKLMRVKITLACTECKQRNYNLTKEKKNHPERMETKKYCPFCKAHTMHKETK